jgi:hypothetical protein
MSAWQLAKTSTKGPSTTVDPVSTLPSTTWHLRHADNNFLLTFYFTFD